MAVVTATYVVERDDAAQLTEFVSRCSARLPMRELEVYSLCIERKMSASAAARELGISRRTVEAHLYNLRKRMSAHEPTPVRNS